MSETTCATQPPIYSAFGVDPDLADLVDLYVEEMPERIASVQQLRDAKNWPDLGRLAHQIKGSAGSYGFDEITPFAYRLEQAAKDSEPPAEIEQAADELVEICLRARTGAPQ
ncbi:MAG: Hpt domain-containing protein [Planctomycetales bacterium]|nr:Hpt domain-containing protein [Planctomycetales bacterium]